MFSSPERRRPTLRHAAAALLLAAAAAGVAAQPATYPGIGRAATAKEVAAWDIDVRPDFKGLPKGSGSVSKGMDVWEAKCASCHGIFGESNEVFSPLVGGTTKDDVRSGRAARLTDPAFPGRTTLMKLSSLSTLWDYIHRAMPWNAPKSLTVDEVYATTAYLLHLGGVLPEDFVLSERNMADVQKRLPNRGGMTTEHGMWPGRGMGNGGRPDVRATACMNDCVAEASLSSFLPDYARNAHGNLADQSRIVGAQLGADTTQPPGTRPRAAGAAAAPAAAADPAAAAAQALLKTHNCLACHGLETKIVGPAFSDVGRKYAGRSDAVDYLSQRIVAGGTGVWGAIPMPAQNVPASDVKAIVQWLAGGARK